MIYITGDTHGDYDWKKIMNWPEGDNLTKNDYVIVAGDWGGIFPANNWDKTFESLLADKYNQTGIGCYEKRPFTTLFVDGNHDVHPYLDSLPVEIWNGGKIHRVSNSIIHLMRGQVYTIEGKKIFTMGGARSTDKDLRIPDVNWWARELPSDDEMREGMENLAQVGYEVDYVITHCAPSDILQYVTWRPKRDVLTDYLLDIEHQISFKDWYFGHYHRDSDIDNFHCLYNSVRKLGE